MHAEQLWKHTGTVAFDDRTGTTYIIHMAIQ